MRAETEVDIVEDVLLLDTDLTLNKLWLCVYSKNKESIIDVCLSENEVVLLVEYCQKFLEAKNAAL